MNLTLDSLMKRSSSIAALLGSAVAAQSSPQLHATPRPFTTTKPGFNNGIDLFAYRDGSSFTTASVGDRFTTLQSSGSSLRIVMRNAWLDRQLDSEVAKLLGVESSARIREFQKLEPGWSFGKGRRVSRASLLGMERFVQRCGVALNAVFGSPLVFLDEEGSLELLWRKVDGPEIFLRFRTEGIDYLITPAGEEGAGDATAVAQVVAASLVAAA